MANLVLPVGVHWRPQPHEDDRALKQLLQLLLQVRCLAVHRPNPIARPAGFQFRRPGPRTSASIPCLESSSGLASCCHSQGDSREEALANIREAITLWLEVEAEEAGVTHVETLELAL